MMETEHHTIPATRSLSRHLNSRQIGALNHVGDAFLPGSGILPSFSSLGVARHVDRVLDYMPHSDRKDLLMLLTILSCCPRLVVLSILWLVDKSVDLPLPSVLRFMRIGLRGLIFTLYYGDTEVHERLGYRVSVYTGDRAQ